MAAPAPAATPVSNVSPALLAAPALTAASDYFEEGIRRRGCVRDSGHNRGRKPNRRLAWGPGVVGRDTPDLYTAECEVVGLYNADCDIAFSG
jgi:hypothetical protein